MGDKEDRNISTPVAPRLTFRTITTGFSHSLALDTKGKVYTWGLELLWVVRFG
jgi:alpha-tubulin suppressor-like RCC1 family protein